MKTSLLTCIFLLIALLCACEDGPPVLPGLTKSRISIITDPDSIIIKLNNEKLENITPYVIDDIEPGFYRIDLSRTTYLDTTIYQVIRRNVTDTLSIEMREEPAYWWKVYNTSNSQIPSNQISKVRVDKENNKWIGTRGSGLIKFIDSTFTIYNTANSGIPDNFINDIYIEDNSILLIATRNGFAKFDGSSWEVFNTSNINIPEDNITSISLDKKGIYWLGTINSGLIKFDGVEVTAYNYSNSDLPINYVSSITVDENNLKWIGTWGEGIATFDGVNWKIYNSVFNGLPNLYISRTG